MINLKRRFYANGLRFSCQQCHNCCRGGQPGWVYPSRREVERMARHLKLAPPTFRERYMVDDPDEEASLRMRRKSDCIFWNNGCTIYPARPRQCRTFPFWAENLESPETWAEVCRSCQGAGHGRLYRLEDIRATLHGRVTK